MQLLLDDIRRYLWDVGLACTSHTALVWLVRLDTTCLIYGHVGYLNLNMTFVYLS